MFVVLRHAIAGLIECAKVKLCLGVVRASLLFGDVGALGGGGGRDLGRGPEKEIAARGRAEIDCGSGAAAIS